MGTTGRILFLGVIAIIAGLPIVAMFIPQQMTVYGVVLTILLGFVSYEYRSEWRFPVTDQINPFLVGVVAFLCYAALTAFWSVDEEQTVQRWFRICGLAVLGFFAVGFSKRVARCNQKLAWIMVTSVLALFALVVIEHFTGFLAASIWRDATERARENLLNRPAMILDLAIWPALLVLWHQGFRLISIVVGLSLPAVLLFTSGQGAFVAAAVGCLVWIIASINARFCAWLIGGGFSVALVATPFLALNVPLINRGLALCADYAFISGAHRLAIWNFVATMAQERPVLGWGLDAARNIPHANFPLASVPNLSKALVLEYPMLPTLPFSQAMPLHPHNAGLQIILETGAVGAIIFCALIVIMTLRLTTPQNLSKAPFSLAALASWLVITGVSVGIWQSWWLASSIIAMIFYSLRQDHNKSPEK